MPRIGEPFNIERELQKTLEECEMGMCGYSDRMVGGKGVQAGKRRAQAEELKKMIVEGKVPKADPVAAIKGMFKAAAAFFMKRSSNRSRGCRG
jgi:hypothetical protein